MAHAPLPLRRPPSSTSPAPRSWRALPAGLAVVLMGPHALPAQDPPTAPLVCRYSVQATTAQVDDDGFMPLDVTLLVTQPEPGRTVFELPVWTPGSYRIRGFPERLRALRASDPEGNALPVQRLRRNAWQVTHGALGAVQIAYRVLLAPSDRFMYAGDSRRCITYEGPAVYLYPVGGKHRPCHVTFALPEGWSAHSGLSRQPDGSWFAADYDVLADCPVKLGRAQRWTIESHGKPLHVVVDAAEDVTADLAPWLANIKTIVDEAGAIFGGLPFAEYSFLFTVGPGGGGGLEHLTSTAIGLRRVGEATAGLGTIAHEFFHVWNVKRLRPIELGPFDYNRPGRSRGLWISEGFTSYYGPLLRARAGLLTADSFWRAAGAAIQSFESSPGRPHVSSREASEGVWGNTAPDRGLSYYTSGQVLAMLLDLELRHRTGNQRSLDDFMRALWQLCEQHGRGFEVHEPALVAEQLAGSSFAAWFDQYPGGTVVPDYERVLGYAGLRYTEERATARALRGVREGRGRLLFADHEQLERLDTYSDIDPFTVAGELLTVAGREVGSLADVAAIVAAQPAGALLRVTYSTLLGVDRAAVAAVEDRQRVRVGIVAAEDATPEQLAIRAGVTAPRR